MMPLLQTRTWSFAIASPLQAYRWWMSAGDPGVWHSYRVAPWRRAKVAVDGTVLKGELEVMRRRVGQAWQYRAMTAAEKADAFKGEIW